MRNRLFGFVAHVGEAEGFALDGAVAGVDDDVMFLAQFFGHGEDIDIFGVFYAGEGLGTVTLFGEKVEAGAADPIVDECVGLGVTREAGVEAFLENFVEF